MSRLIVLEVNEMPRRVLEWWGKREPASPLWQLARAGTVTETHLIEDLPRDLYPSQSWASVGMGVPWEKHGVFWYGDAKPADYAFYWQAAAAAGQSVGLVGVLHSSPLDSQCPDPNIRFAVPDCFAVHTTARPAGLVGLQRLNLRLSKQSARVANLSVSPADLGGLTSFLRNGVRPETLLRSAELAANVGRRAWNKERLRVGQALLLADVFERQTKRHDPDLAVFFTNHIASAMHRYWAANFPEDWGGDLPYTEEWRAKHSEELPFAMRALDRIVARMQRLAHDTNRTVVIVTSMGQQADPALGSDPDVQAVVRDPQRFVAFCGVEGCSEIRSAMVPQLTLVFPGEQAATTAEEHLTKRLGSALAETMTSGTPGSSKTALTITYQLPCRTNEVQIGDQWVAAEDVGVSIEQINDHRSGRHSPDGLLISDRVEAWPADLDAFAVAPVLLELLGVAPLPHHLDHRSETRRQEHGQNPYASTTPQ